MLNFNTKSIYSIINKRVTNLFYAVKMCFKSDMLFIRLGYCL